MASTASAFDSAQCDRLTGIPIDLARTLVPKNEIPILIRVDRLLRIGSRVKHRWDDLLPHSLLEERFDVVFTSGLDLWQRHRLGHGGWVGEAGRMIGSCSGKLGSVLTGPENGPVL